MKNSLYTVSLLAGLAGAVVCGCAHQPGETDAPAAFPKDSASVQAPRGISPPDLTPGGGKSSDFVRPPAAREEVAPTAPGAEYFWVAGYWNWTGADWAWVPGVWDMPAHPGAKWSEAHWDKTDGKVVWVVGQWR